MLSQPSVCEYVSAAVLCAPVGCMNVLPPVHPSHCLEQHGLRYCVRRRKRDDFPPLHPFPSSLLSLSLLQQPAYF